MRKIFAADLWPVSGATSKFLAEASQQLAQGQMRLRQLVENLLFYDQVILPVDDFIGLKVLGDAFGTEGVATMIDAEVLRFARVHGSLAYAGEGHGLVTISAVDRASGPTPPMWMPTGVAARAIFAAIEGEDNRRAKQMGAKVASYTKDIQLGHYSKLIEERAFAAVRSASISPDLAIPELNLRSLPGKKNNEIVVTGPLNQPLEPNNDIGRLMRVARTELEIVGKEVTQCSDISTLSPIGKVIAAHTATAMTTLFQITDVPDVGEATLRGALNLQQIISLRESRNWQEFVRWFHEACNSDSDQVGREYVKLLKKAGPLDTAFFKTVRILVPTVLGLMPGGAAIGVLVEAADTFLLQKIKEPSPKYFIEELEQLTLKQRPKSGRE